MFIFLPRRWPPKQPFQYQHEHIDSTPFLSFPYLLDLIVGQIWKMTESRATITFLVLTTIMLLRVLPVFLSYPFPREQPSGPASTGDLSSPRTKPYPWASCELTPKVRRGSSQCSEFCSSFVYRHYVKITVTLASDLNVWYREDLIPSPKHFLGIVQDLTLPIVKRLYLPAPHDLESFQVPPRSHPVTSLRLIATL